MARYSLRNAHKIIAHYDKDTYLRIRFAIHHYFFNNNKIESEKIENEKYETIIVDDPNHTCGLIVFYIIKKTYDVYNLAFKEFIS